MDGRARVAFVAAKEVQSIRLAYGVKAERPLFTGVVGVLLSVGGAAALALASTAAQGDVLRGARWAVYVAIAFIGVGGAMLSLVVRKGYYLAVSTPVGLRKILLGQKVDETAALAFLEDARRMLGYPSHAGEDVRPR